MKLLVTMLLAHLLCGCAIAGWAIGAATPKTEVKVVEEPATHADSGDSVRVVLDSGRSVIGWVRAHDASKVQIQRATSYPDVVETVWLPIDDIRTMYKRVERRTKSNEAVKGFTIGLSIDVTVGALLGTIAAIVLGAGNWVPR